MTVVSKDNAKHYFWGEQCDGWHLVQSGNLSVIQERVPSGCGESRHYHVIAEQFFFVLSGVATIELEGKLFQLQSHQGLHVKAGMSHQVTNNEATDLVFTVTSTPPSHGDRVDRV
ncbi:cupin domain-containing protein [Litorilituus lipolyticus]|uniref:Cupin domain-containing protein n=1 Tax=Litorilituus lipolyticus TaxID=2491017 RepID=A0A502L253_9GAMM|nr:cupin domain-containing protein [Litorilituus lipolyticus]TPH17294.1 cupin domain-containing protein [Litorilituus lipolyticus]